MNFGDEEREYVLSIKLPLKVAGICQALDRDWRRNILGMITNLWPFIKCYNFFPKWGIVSSSRRSLFHRDGVLKLRYLRSFSQPPKIGASKTLISPVLCGWMEPKKLDVFWRKASRKTFGPKRMRQTCAGSLHSNYSTRNCEKVNVLGHDAV